MTDYKILFKLTTRARVKNAMKTIDSIYDLAASKNFELLISIDYDDEPSKDGLAWLMIAQQNDPYYNFHFRSGLSKNKVDAINRDVNEFPFKWDILVNVSDDQVFTVKGFDNIIRDSFDNLDRVVHFPDNHRADLMTMSIMGYDAYKRDNYIYHPSYEGQFCDNEAQVVAQKRGVYKFVDKVIFNHNHPNYIGGDRDELYRKYDALFNKDHQNFIYRQSINFEL
jgi:hypothetical protein